MEAKSVEVWGTGSPFREFLHVDDLADACVFLMKNYHGSEIINIGTGIDLTIRELAGMIKDVVGYNGEIFWDRAKPDGTPRKLLDISRIAALGWQPRISLRDGLRSTYEWYVKHGEYDIKSFLLYWLPPLLWMVLYSLHKSLSSEYTSHFLYPLIKFFSFLYTGNA